MAEVRPIAPRADPWFRAPAGYESEKPGAVLRVRLAQGNLGKTFPGAAAIYNVLFRTTDSLYRPSFGVTTLFIPKLPADKHALLSYTIPYNSCDIDAGPSFLLHSVNETFWETILDNVGRALARGQFVSFPDHWGEYGACGDGIIAGHTTIDAIRSVLRLGFGLDSSRVQIGLWGYSGGAIAAAWAAQLQPHYAPELTFAGRDIFAFFEDGEGIFTHPLVGGLLFSHSVLGYHGIPETPLFFYKAINDELAPVQDTDLLVERWGAIGVNIVYERNTEGQHIVEAEAGQPRAEAFLDAVMTGTYIHQGLTIRDVTVLPPTKA